MWSDNKGGEDMKIMDQWGWMKEEGNLRMAWMTKED